MDHILEIRQATKKFGGLTANENVTFDVDRNTIVGIVGPNGAGKTTLFNSISGVHSLTSGNVIFEGRDITKMKPYDICHLGMGRTFQIPLSLNEMTVLENVLVASLGRHKMAKARETAEAVIEECGLKDFIAMPAGSLNVLQKKRLEIARALATEPKLLLLDETMAGLSGIERQDATALIRQIHARGVTILMIEHVMEIVMNVSDKVVVLNGGKLLMEGTPKEVASNEEVILKAEHLQSGYQGTPVLHDISFEVEEGKIVAILGSNGAGKTTTLRTLTGTVRATGGHVWYNGEEITKTPTYKMSQMGIALVPEGRHLFNQMSVRDNLLMGSYRVKDKALVQQRLEQMYEIFPRIQERSNQLAGTLSGGEQQMVAIARGMMCGPKLLMLDEPSLGLMPKLVEEVFSFVQRINKLGTTIVIVEQNVNETLKFADYAYIVSEGEIALHGTPQELLKDDEIRRIYLGHS